MILYILNVLENFNAILEIESCRLTKLIIVIGRKYFSNYVAQKNY